MALWTFKELPVEWIKLMVTKGKQAVKVDERKALKTAVKRVFEKSVNERFHAPDIVTKRREQVE